MIVAETLRDLRRMVEPGVTTLQLDAYAEKKIRSADAYPTFKGYRGFPASICASVNDEVVHGIPSDRKLRDGDIISDVRDRAVESLADFYRILWASGPAGTDIPLRVIRDGRDVWLRIKSADRNDFLKKPVLQ